MASARSSSRTIRQMSSGRSVATAMTAMGMLLGNDQAQAACRRRRAEFCPETAPLPNPGPVRDGWPLGNIPHLIGNCPHHGRRPAGTGRLRGQHDCDRLAGAGGIGRGCSAGDSQRRPRLRARSGGDADAAARRPRRAGRRRRRDALSPPHLGPGAVRRGRRGRTDALGVVLRRAGPPPAHRGGARRLPADLPVADSRAVLEPADPARRRPPPALPAGPARPLHAGHVSGRRARRRRSRAADRRRDQRPDAADPGRHDGAAVTRPRLHPVQPAAARTPRLGRDAGRGAHRRADRGPGRRRRDSPGRHRLHSGRGAAPPRRQARARRPHGDVLGRPGAHCTKAA